MLSGTLSVVSNDPSLNISTVAVPDMDLNCSLTPVLVFLIPNEVPCHDVGTPVVSLLLLCSVIGLSADISLFL